ncbi:unnamed protein product, partial [Brenthis ino]
MFLLTLLAVVCLSSKALSNSLFTPCKTNDKACIDKSVSAVIPQILSGIPSLGVESSDPLFIEKIEGNLSILKYKFFNTTIVGYKTCVVKDLRVNPELTNLHYDLHCPHLKMTGQYEMDGRLIVLPVQGKGDYGLITGNYMVTVDSEMKTVQGNDGKNHLSIKNFKLICQPLSANHYDFKNLFNGRKDLSDAVHNFAHQSWKEVSELVQEPTWYAALKKIHSHVNKFLKSVPLDEMVKS